MNGFMTGVARSMALAGAVAAAGPACAATNLTYIFHAQGMGTAITGYDNDGPIRSAFSGAIIRFVVSVDDDANVGFGFADSPIILSPDADGLRFRLEPVRYGVSGGGLACVSGGIGDFPPLTGQATDAGCSTVSINTVQLGGLGTSFVGTITRFDVLEGRVGEDFDYIPLVPEPATWALTLLGFGLAGYVLRQRRATIAVARG